MEEIYIKTDDMQFVHKQNETDYIVLDIVETPDDTYLCKRVWVGLEWYTNEDLEAEISGYGYTSLDNVRELYGDSANQIIAECIAENTQFDEDTEHLKTIEEVNNWLKENKCNHIVE